MRIDPIHHLVADTNVVHPGKPGRPPSDRTHPRPHYPRNHSPPLDTGPASGKPIPAKTDQPNWLTHDRSNPHSYWAPTAPDHPTARSDGYTVAAGCPPVVWGIFASLFDPAASAYVADVAPPELRTEAFGLKRLVNNASFARRLSSRMRRPAFEFSE